MQNKIYVVGMDDEATASKVDAAVKAVSGVNSVVSSAEKCQVLVDFNENTAGIEASIKSAIESVGVTPVG